MSDKYRLDYFSFDVDFFDDEKIKFVKARFGEKGELLVIKLLTRIYRNGYCLTWDEDMQLLFADSAGVTHGLVNDVVNELFKRGFLDKPLHERFGILTGSGVQKRWKRAIQILKRDVKIPEEHDLKYRVLEKMPKIPEKIDEPPEKTGEIPAKGKESKGKESKGKQTDERARENVFKKSILEDQTFIENQCLKNHLTEKEFTGAAEIFFQEKRDSKEYEKWVDESDCRRNLMSWLPYYVSMKNAPPKNGHSKYFTPDATTYVPTVPNNQPEELISGIDDGEKKKLERAWLDRIVINFMDYQNTGTKPKRNFCSAFFDSLEAAGMVTVSNEEKKEIWDVAKIVYMTELTEKKDRLDLKANRSLKKIESGNLSDEDQVEVKIIAKEIALTRAWDKWIKEDYIPVFELTH